MKIILVRHGESESNVMGISNGERNMDLTGKGRTQASYLGNRLKKQKISEIYTSNLKRSKQTAEIISKIIKVPIKESFEELNEYSNHHIRHKIIHLFSMRAKKLKKLLKRILKEKNEDKTILIVAHANTNRLIISYLLQIPVGRQFFRLRQHNTGINVLSWNEAHKNWALFSMNDIAHLPKELIDKEHETNIL